MKYLSVLEQSLSLYQSYPDAAYCCKVILEISDELDRIIPKTERNKRGLSIFENSQQLKLDTSNFSSNPTRSNLNSQGLTGNKSEAVIMDELLLNDVNINAKLIRDIAPYLYQAIDLFRRKGHDLTNYDYQIFEKSLKNKNEINHKSPLLDKLFTVGILAVLSQDQQTALNIFQTEVSDNFMDLNDWTENYLAAQLQVAVCLFAKNSEIKRNSLVSHLRNQEQGIALVEQSWRPKFYAKNLGSIVDLLSYYSKRKHEITQERKDQELEALANPELNAAKPGEYTSWIVHASTISNMIRAVPEFAKLDPIKTALFNLIQAHNNIYDDNLIDSRIHEILNFSKAISDETEIFINELTIWEKCADLFSLCLLPNISLTKSLKECRITENGRKKKNQTTHKIRRKPARVDTGLSSYYQKKLPNTARSSEAGDQEDASQTKQVIDSLRIPSFKKREDRKMHDMVKNVWDQDLFATLEQEIKFEVEQDIPIE